jgi:hypothetical protein
MDMVAAELCISPQPAATEDMVDALEPFHLLQNHDNGRNGIIDLFFSERCSSLSLQDVGLMWYLILLKAL